MHENGSTLDVQSISGWNYGEPSSRLGLQNQQMQDALDHRLGDDGRKMEQGSSHDACNQASPRSEERRIEPPNVFFTGRLNNERSGNLVRSEPMCLQSFISNHIPSNVNLSEGFISGSGTGVSGVGTGGSPNLHNSGGLEREQISNAFVSADNIGSSSGSSNYVGEENTDGPGYSLDSWGLSCKRKALEGTSGQSADTSGQLASGNPNTSGSIPSSNRYGSSSSTHPLPAPAWIPPHNPPIHDQQRLSEFAPWSPIDSESGGHNGRFPLPSSNPYTSSQETMVTSESNSQGIINHTQG
ncbi:E3 ubiquitin-protein ligase MBR1-like [Hibiscus syriacus]|uniref:E3 ubiquitin-protein ligase MBR1-like n=1 Tax=Hibiscus syriacus TaxID=106335 RepID=UPI001921080C|nr:E3 ubiquitin-protein ligase MBR1-like [Hibiscus syriacus]